MESVSACAFEYRQARVRMRKPDRWHYISFDNSAGFVFLTSTNNNNKAVAISAARRAGGSRIQTHNRNRNDSNNLTSRVNEIWNCEVQAE